MNKPKLFIGPVSKNIVDVVIELSNQKDLCIALIHSRRQIDYDSGYVNNWTTKTFTDYIRSKSTKVLIERDHAGPAQGNAMDDGINSLEFDSKYDFDILHIDPWKYVDTFNMGLELTINLVNKVCDINNSVVFEVGTEAAIRKYKNGEFEVFLANLQMKLGERFKRIKYASIQGGTRILENKNIGQFDSLECSRYIQICKKFGLFSKEHNGDYLTPEQINDRFSIGLDSINIAPEFGFIESNTLLDAIENNSDDKSFEKFFDICYKSNQWQKWMSINIEELNTFRLKKKIIQVSGHYIFSHPEFLLIKEKYLGIDANIKERIKHRFEEKIVIKKEINQSEKEKTIYTNKEKFEYLAKKNTNLTDLKNKLGLDYEF